MKCILFLTAIVAVQALASLLPAAERPNIVFLFADDLGYGDLGCQGHPYARTPNLDRLAREGTRMERFYVTGVTCCPSRTGFMTSRFPARFQKYPAGPGYGERVTVTELLKQSGYVTGHFGKWHMGADNNMAGTYGFDVVASGDDEFRRRRDAAADGGRDAGLYRAAIDFIEANREQPFYVNVWGHSTHFPVNPPAEFAERFRDVRVNEADFGPAMREKFAQVRELGGDVGAAMRNYLGDVAALDDQVGTLLNRLDELGLRERTLVVFSSDHGPAPVLTAKHQAELEAGGAKGNTARYMVNMLGSPGPFRGGKHTMLEGGVRVPFILRWPGRVPAGRVDERSVTSGIDWLPTICAVAGVKLPETADYDGEDVSAAWTGGVHDRTKPLFWKTSSPNAPVGILDGPWKYYHAGRNRRAETGLYDVVKDPGEQHNLLTSQPKVVAVLQQKISTWETQLPASYENFKDNQD